MEDKDAEKGQGIDPEQKAAEPDGGHRNARYVLAGAFILALAAIASPIVFNYVSVGHPVNEVVESDQRNHGITVSAHFDNYLNTSTLVFDLLSISGTNSRLDVFRVLNQSAERLKDSQFEAVVLAYRGQRKFIIDGDYFRKPGMEYATQNAVYNLF